MKTADTLVFVRIRAPGSSLKLNVELRWIVLNVILSSQACALPNQTIASPWVQDSGSCKWAVPLFLIVCHSHSPHRFLISSGAQACLCLCCAPDY